MQDAQFHFDFPKRGGFRKGSGRKKTKPHELPHTARPPVNVHTPFHCCIKLHRGVPGLRFPRMLREILAAFRRAKAKGFYVNQFAIESNHIHLIAEADSNRALTAGMQSLAASLTWALRRTMRYRGQVFQKRYFIHVLRGATAMRNALKYVLFNHAKHLKAKLFADVYSSAFAFGEIHVFLDRLPKTPAWQGDINETLSSPRTRLQSTGWQRW